MRRESRRVELRLGHTDGRGVRLRRRVAVDLEDLTRRRIGRRDDQAPRAGPEVLELEGGEGVRGLEDREDGRIAEEAPLPVDRRAREGEVVACRATDDGDVSQRLVERRHQRLLGEAEPVGQQDPEGAATGGEALHQGTGRRGHRSDALVALGQRFDEERVRGQALAGDARRGHPTALVARPPDLARAGAPDDGAWEGAADLPPERVQVVGGRAEEQDGGEPRLVDGGAHLGDRGGGIRGPRATEAY